MTVCPHCGVSIEGITARGPSDHRLTPCGHSVGAQTARDLAGDDVERGQAVVADGGLRFGDLHAFERDLLYAVRALERDGDAPKGFAIQDYLKAEYTEEIHHSRLYQNLDALVTKGLLTKGQKDGRTNKYATTDAGRELLERVTKHRAEAVGLDADRGRGVVTDGGGEVEPGWVSVELDAEEVERIVSERETVERDRSEDGYRLFVGANGLNGSDLVQTFQSTPEAPVELKVHPHLARSVVNTDHVERFSYIDAGVAFTVAGKLAEEIDA